jgi:hypothetical protein
LPAPAPGQRVALEVLWQGINNYRGKFATVALTAKFSQHFQLIRKLP